MPTEHDAPHRDIRVANAHYDGDSAAADFERDHGPLAPPARTLAASVANGFSRILRMRTDGRAA